MPYHVGRMSISDATSKITESGSVRLMATNQSTKPITTATTAGGYCATAATVTQQTALAVAKYRTVDRVDTNR
ncbi:hypothetical protein JCM9957A_14570 [Kineosporia succinea]